ncbi:MAG: hypothetical protein ACD_65C00273G0003 [uncultured bacterium]|nr:MAG: hypothetical protein ACD_65C00273G0003 [uncultured bacterium]KKT02976.1 MAG: hypothetical protein UV80_C0001G0078 [Candidatus Peregrinibacteria bacterium GW2011_GWF2_43_17]KKT20473.1 MAG: hypothetical protein UW03_C0003G0009 [Candidatus Peregrinibacteria bacterium GW2011_GWA2_43_8]HAU40320.1 hypothetical protein [Candidatus Peregrinibacteria bacterium]
MERLPTKRKVLNPTLSDRDYVEALTAGFPRVALIKIQIKSGCTSSVLVGTQLDGILQVPIVVGGRVRFDEGKSSVSEIVEVRVEADGKIFLETATSVYRLRIDQTHAGRFRSLQYLRRGYLDFDEQIPNGFYDGGHKMQFAIDSDGRLECESSDRELIFVDAIRDTCLQSKVEGARKFIESAPTTQAKIQMLAMFVSNALGGSQMVADGYGDIVQLTEANIQRCKISRANVDDVVLLGYLNHGVCRHRAILFKYLADRLGIQSRLVRGKQARDQWHCWNVVELDGKNYIVDVMQQPWKLIEEGSPEVDIYRRATHEKGRRIFAGMGGGSIVIGK